MKKIIEVSAKLDKIKHWDFGTFPYYLADKKLKVSLDIWHDFIEARTRYEMIYEELKEAIEKK